MAEKSNTIILPTSKKRMPSQDEPLTIILDCGNSDVKAMISGHFGEEIVFPQVVRKPTRNEYESIAASYKTKSSQFSGSAIFETGSGDTRTGFVIGNHAALVGTGIRKSGPDKYTRDHMGAILKAVLFMLYGKSHQDVQVIVLHPVGISAESRIAIGQSVAKRHKISLPTGEQLEWNVTDVKTLEEVVAGLHSFLLTQKGETHDGVMKELQPGKTALTIDIGGYISTIGRCRVADDGHVEPILSGMEPIQVGIQNVIATFQREILAGVFAKKVPGLSKINKLELATLHSALMTGEIELKGVAYDCKAQVKNAMRPLVDPLEQDYRGIYGSGFNDIFVVLSGGGGGIASSHLRETLLDHPNVKDAELPKRMRYSNVAGASKTEQAHFLGVKNG